MMNKPITLVLCNRPVYSSMQQAGAEIDRDKMHVLRISRVNNAIETVDMVYHFVRDDESEFWKHDDMMTWQEFMDKMPMKENR